MKGLRPNIKTPTNLGIDDKSSDSSDTESLSETSWESQKVHEGDEQEPSSPKGIRSK